jgi:hypothetical protein
MVKQLVKRVLTTTAVHSYLGPTSYIHSKPLGILHTEPIPVDETDHARESLPLKIIYATTFAKKGDSRIETTTELGMSEWT